MHWVKLAQFDKAFPVRPGQTILEAALAARCNFPFACQTRTCGVCKARLVSGHVAMEGHSPTALTAEEADQGLFLACCSVPMADCEVLHLAEEAPPHPLRHAIAEVIGLAEATHDIRILRLAILDGPPLEFSAGQFVRLTLPGAPPRDYSMASRPDQAELEFHIRRIARGSASVAAHSRLRCGDKIVLEGPYGNSHLRLARKGPILAIAGGSGLAPMRSIVETALAAGIEDPVRLYFGVRDERDLYGLERLAALAGAHRNFAFVPVLSEPTTSTGRRTGFVGDAILVDFADLRGWQTYVAGPPPMVHSATAALQRLGASDIHADAFYTSADAPAAQPAAD